MSYNLQYQTNVVPKELFGLGSAGGSDVSMSVSPTGIILKGDLNTASPITATISQAGIITDNPTGFNILSSLNMNQQDVTNVATMSNSMTDLNISSNGDNVNISAGSNVVFNSNINFIVNSSDSVAINATGGSANAIQLNATSSNILATTPLTSIIDGANNDYINLDMRTNIDQIPTIELMKDNLIATISKNNDLFITTDQGLYQTSEKPMVFKCNNGIISLWTPNNKVFIDKTSTGTGDGEIVCSAITGSLNGNASTASFANTATTATQASYIQVNNTSSNLTHYLGFYDSITAGYKIPQVTNGLTFNPNSNTLSTTTFVGSLTGSCSTTGLVFISSGSVAITGSSSATNFSIPSVFYTTYKNYRIVLYPTTQLSFGAYPSYSLQAFLGSGTLPTTASLYGNELTSNSPSALSVVYTAGATIASTPLTFAVSQSVNHQTVFEIENVGFANTQTQQIGIKCKSFYANPGVSGYSDRNILCASVSGATITGLVIQQGAISVGNNMTLGWTVYGYK